MLCDLWRRWRDSRPIGDMQKQSQQKQSSRHHSRRGKINEGQPHRHVFTRSQMLHHRSLHHHTDAPLQPCLWHTHRARHLTRRCSTSSLVRDICTFLIYASPQFRPYFITSLKVKFSIWFVECGKNTCSFGVTFKIKVYFLRLLLTHYRKKKTIKLQPGEIYQHQSAAGGKDGGERQRKRGSDTEGKRDEPETKRDDASKAESDVD